MGKDKLRKFRENEEMHNVVQPTTPEARSGLALKGRWSKDQFSNGNGLVVELGCGKGEYTVELARRTPDKNHIGVDIKGARMWRGAKTATEEGLENVAFLRTRIDFIEHCFEENEVDEIWITFPDPQIKHNRAKHRLTHPQYLLKLVADSGIATSAVKLANNRAVAGHNAENNEDRYRPETPPQLHSGKCIGAHLTHHIDISDGHADDSNLSRSDGCGKTQ